MKIAVWEGKDQETKKIVRRRINSSGFRKGNWPLDVSEENIPCPCGYTGEGNLEQRFPICNSKVICPECGADLDKEIEEVLV